MSDIVLGTEDGELVIINKLTVCCCWGRGEKNTQALMNLLYTQ